MQRLKILFQNIRQEFQRSPLQCMANFCAIMIVIISIGASVMDYKFASSNPVNKLLQEKVEGNLLLILMSVILLVWSLLLLIKINKNKSDIYIRLDPVKEKILNIVAANDRLYDAQIAKLADITKQLSTLHLHELREAKFVRSSFGIDENSHKVDIWFIEQQGRKYLSHHGLL